MSPLLWALAGVAGVRALVVVSLARTRKKPVRARWVLAELGLAVALVGGGVQTHEVWSWIGSGLAALAFVVDLAQAVLRAVRTAREDASARNDAALVAYWTRQGDHWDGRWGDRSSG